MQLLKQAVEFLARFAERVTPSPQQAHAQQRPQTNFDDSFAAAACSEPSCRQDARCAASEADAGRHAHADFGLLPIGAYKGNACKVARGQGMSVDKSVTWSFRSLDTAIITELASAARNIMR